MTTTDTIKTEYEPATEQELAAVKVFIKNSPDASDLSKKAVIWLLDQTRLLTRNVVSSFKYEDGSREIHNGVHDMRSCNGKTEIGAVLRLLGEKQPAISGHVGQHDYSTGEFSSRAEGDAVWVSREGDYDHDAELIKPDMEAIKAIRLETEELFPNKIRFPKRD